MCWTAEHLARWTHTGGPVVSPKSQQKWVCRSCSWRRWGKDRHRLSHRMLGFPRRSARHSSGRCGMAPGCVLQRMSSSRFLRLSSAGSLAPQVFFGFLSHGSRWSAPAFLTQKSACSAHGLSMAREESDSSRTPAAHNAQHRPCLDKLGPFQPHGTRRGPKCSARSARPAAGAGDW